MSHDDGQGQSRHTGEELDIALAHTGREQPYHDFVGAGRSQFDVIADTDTLLVEHHTPHGHSPRSAAVCKATHSQ